MKKFSKVLAVILAAMFMFGCFTACSGNKADSDLAYVQEKGTLVVGVTVFAPMDYKDSEGNWVGFDADLAAMFAEKLGVKAELIIIDWGSKFEELETKGIDCVWNGMTITDEVTLNSSVSQAYATNKQVVVMAADKVNDYTTVESLKDLTFAVENGSAGQSVAEENGLNTVAVNSQADTLLEVKAGGVDACIIDSTMADAMTGEGTDYANLTSGIALVDESYGISFRKDSDLVAEINSFLDECKANGSLQELADKYGVVLA